MNHADLAQRAWQSLSWRPRQAMRTVRHNVGFLPNVPSTDRRIYLGGTLMARHPIWATYWTHPPVAYVPYPFADLCHWFNFVPHMTRKSYVLEVEHILAIGRYIWDWAAVIRATQQINETVESESCRVVFTFSNGLAEHSKRYLRPELWSKLEYVYPAFPVQPVARTYGDGPVRLLCVASRFSDKGVPEVLESFAILRQKFGAEVSLLVVCQAVPSGTVLPEGVELLDVPRMDPETKQRVYSSADILVLPCYSETVGPIIESYAFGLPVITTRIHHDDEFVREGESGFLIRSPLAQFSDNFGTVWKANPDFQREIEARRTRGEMQAVIDDIVDRVALLMADRSRVRTLGEGARRFHRECFSPEARNASLERIYDRALQ